MRLSALALIRVALECFSGSSKTHSGKVHGALLTILQARRRYSGGMVTGQNVADVVVADVDNDMT